MILLSLTNNGWKDLHPTRDELLKAAQWTRTQDPSDGFFFILGELLRHLGHEDLASRL
ncbi:MAG TPA: hypothetical protein VNQ90_06510 [Chthoniobacteraceae bacterium]|nr:hypothetical protein [Chthoniobacteraceae bacterium]